MIRGIRPIAVLITALLVCAAARQEPRPPDAQAEQPPGVTILYLNDVEGRLEVCDCYKKMPGGLARGAALIRLIRRDNPNVVVVDSGDVVGARPTSALVETLVQAYRSFACAAINLSPRDAEYLCKLGEDHEGGLLLVATNAPQDPTYADVRRRIVTGVGGHKIAILGVAAGERWRDPAAAVQDEIGKARGEAELVVLLSRLPLDQNRSLASDVPGIDILIGAADASKLTAPERVGRTWIVPTGRFGQSVGRLDVRFGPDEPQIAWSQVSISADIPKDEALQKMIREHYADLAKRFEGMGPGPDQAVRVPFAIEPECATCHGRAHLAWRRSRHSEAYSTLEERDRNLVPECLACHSEFYRATKMPSKAPDAQRGIECATCHGDGKAHTADPKPGSIQRFDLTKCLECHDEEHSPNFDPKAGWEKIKH
jgi:hypothetical protein